MEDKSLLNEFILIDISNRIVLPLIFSQIKFHQSSSRLNWIRMNRYPRKYFWVNHAQMRWLDLRLSNLVQRPYFISHLQLVSPRYLEPKTIITFDIAVTVKYTTVCKITDNYKTSQCSFSQFNYGFWSTRYRKPWLTAVDKITSWWDMKTAFNHSFTWKTFLASYQPVSNLNCSSTNQWRKVVYLIYKLLLANLVICRVTLYRYKSMLASILVSTGENTNTFLFVHIHIRIPAA